jgi:bifunctional non-homologous end joining protein LigD
LSVLVKKPKATCVKPVVQAEIEYGGITDDGLLREAVFKGLRDDLPLVAAPPPAPSRARRGGKGLGGVPCENILQLLPDTVAPSKEELAVYWRKVAKRALPFLAPRPLSSGRRVSVAHRKARGRRGRARVGRQPRRTSWARRDGRGRGAPLGSTVDDIEHADRLVFDLDPGPGISWDFVIASALRMRGLLEREGLKSWPKLTGGKGLHLMAPLSRKLTHDAAHAHARRLAQRLARTDAERYVTSASLARRPGRLFIDYLRNGRGTTAVGVYSPRVREGFPIAAPVNWKQVERGIGPDAFTMSHPFRRANVLTG